MSLSDYLLDTLLILLVVRQVRTAPFTRRTWLLPLVIVAVVGKSYLHSVPTSGNNLVLIGILTLVGVALGLLSGLTTRVWHDGEKVLLKAGYVAAGLWVLGMGSRMAFAIWAAHSGGATISRFSASHGIDSADAWTAALVLMALGEVIARVGVLVLRAEGAKGAKGAAPLPAAAVRA